MSRATQSYELHGYQPIIVDETCLNDADERQALLGAINASGDWDSYLTSAERQAFTKEIDAIARVQSSYVYIPGSPGDSARHREKRFEMSRLGAYRAYARRKYADGHKVWYGDGIPFRQSDG